MSNRPISARVIARIARPLIGMAATATVFAAPLNGLASPAQASVICPSTMAFDGGSSLGITMVNSNCASTVITSPPVNDIDRYPQISPDHRTVAFTQSDESVSPTTEDIFVAPITGGQEVRVTNLGCTGYLSEAWSPDSTKLAVACEESPSNSELYLAQANGSGVTKLAPLQLGSHGIAWCGTKLVLPYPGGIYTMNADGTGQRLLWSASNASFYGDPTCTPDGKWVLFDEQIVGSVPDIYAVPLAGGTATRLTQGGGDGSAYPTVSSDWTLTYEHWSGGSSPQLYLVNQWLGGSLNWLGPTNGFSPAAAPSNNLSHPPGAFPVLGQVPPNPGVPSNCPPAQFFGVRGSGETATDYGGYGKTIFSVKSRLGQLIHNLGSAPIDYPAIAVQYDWQQYGDTYKNSVHIGEDKLKNALLQFWQTCPNTYVILAGYSQGAQVVGDLVDSLPGAQRSHIGAVVLFGDTRFNSSQSAVDVAATGYDSTLNGIYQFLDPTMRTVPTDLIKRFRSYCLSGDVVCNYNHANLAYCTAHLGLCPHLFYEPNGWTTKAAEWAAAKLATLPHL